MGCHLHFCKVLSGFSYLVHSFRRSHQSCFLGTCCLSSTSLLFAMPKCVDLNECTMPTILSNFRAGRHDRSLAKSAVCLKCCCWPLSNPWSLFHAIMSHLQPYTSITVAISPRISASASIQDCLHHHFSPGAGISWSMMTRTSWKTSEVFARVCLLSLRLWSTARQKLGCTRTLRWNSSICSLWPQEQYHPSHLSPHPSHSSHGAHQQQALPQPEARGICRTADLYKLASQYLTTLLWLPLWMEQVCIPLWVKRSPWAAAGLQS